MTRQSGDEWVPGMPVGRRGLRGSYDPFYEFKQLAREDGEHHEPRRPTLAGRLALTVLSGRPALVVMTGLAVAVGFVLIVLIVASVA